MYNRLRSSLAPKYEDFQPLTETKENPESNLLLIHLPGFKRDQVGAKYDSANKRIRVFGERSLGVDNKYSRFNLAYPLPENCDVNRLQRRFEEETLTIVMPKKVVSQIPPKEEPKPTEQETAATPSKPAADLPKPAQEASVTPAKPAVDQPKPEKAPEPIPPKSTTPKVEEPKPPVEAQKDHESASREAETTTDKQKQQPTIAQPKPEKTQEVLPPKSAPKVEEPKSTTEVQKTKTAVDKQEQDEKRPDAIIPRRDTSDSMPQKEEIHKKPTVTTETKDQADHDQKLVAATIADNVEKQRVEEKKEMKEESIKKEKEKSSVGGSSDQKESKGERKESSLVAVAEISAMRKVKEEEKINGKVDAVAGGKGKENGIEPKGKGIQEVITRMKKKLRDEDKQTLMYVGAGAAIIVAAAIGAYAYKFRSLPR